MEQIMSVPLILSCPPGCVCKSQTFQQWKHVCGHPLYLSEEGFIFCQVCDGKLKKGCLIKDYPFQCSAAKKEFLMGLCQAWREIDPFDLDKGVSMRELQIKLKQMVMNNWNSSAKQQQMSIPLVLPCPPECVCECNTFQQWNHSCGSQLYLSEKAQIYCKVCHGNPEKGCFIQEYPFQCPAAKKCQKQIFYRYSSQFLMNFSKGLDAGEFSLKSTDLDSFSQKIWAEVCRRWDI